MLQQLLVSEESLVCDVVPIQSGEPFPIEAEHLVLNRLVLGQLLDPVAHILLAIVPGVGYLPPAIWRSSLSQGWSKGCCVVQDLELDKFFSGDFVPAHHRPLHSIIEDAQHIEVPEELSLDRICFPI